jgi:hypothetical protein
LQDGNGEEQVNPLLVGDKAGDAGWYFDTIGKAEATYESHLIEVGEWPSPPLPQRMAAKYTKLSRHALGMVRTGEFAHVLNRD